MYKKLLLIPISIAIFTLINVGSPVLARASSVPPPTFAAVDCQQRFLLPTWYKYLKFNRANDNCDVVMTKEELPKNIILIGLAIIEMLLVLAGVIAVVMVMIGGFKYVVSQGEPEKIGNAKMTIINALLGAVIAIIASQVVAYIGGAFGGGSPDEYGLIHVSADAGNLKRALEIFFVIIGAVSVFMIVLSGFNFVTSGGDSEKTKKARRTIYYAVIGLIVAIFASVIVSFVLGGVI